MLHLGGAHSRSRFQPRHSFSHKKQLNTLRAMSEGSHIIKTAVAKNPRTTVRLTTNDSGRELRQGTPFRIVQWNILADGLAQNGDFIRAPPNVLEWAYRRPLILAELSEAAADIICLQEVNHFDEISQVLLPQGYEGDFLPKNRSPCERYQCPADGVAVFHNTQRFQRVGDALGVMFLDEQGAACSQGFLQVRLRDCLSGHELLIVTTHLKAKEGAAEEQARIRQIRQLLHHLKQYLVGSTAVPVILTGDFNATPESQTCREIKLHPAGLQSLWDVRSAHGDASACNVEDGALCSIDDAAGSLPPRAPHEFSTWKFRSKGESKRIIDHCWFSPSVLQPLQRWRMMDEAEIGPNGLPSATYASDHQALMAEFLLGV